MGSSPSFIDTVAARDHSYSTSQSSRSLASLAVFRPSVHPNPCWPRGSYITWLSGQIALLSENGKSRGRRGPWGGGCRKEAARASLLAWRHPSRIVAPQGEADIRTIFADDSHVCAVQRASSTFEGTQYFRGTGKPYTPTSAKSPRWREDESGSSPV